MVIKGAERIKVIVPGHLSGFPSEAEVILPRGILLKINKVSTYMMKETAYNKYLIEGTIVPPSEQLEESVYD
ncbi:ADP-ribosyltransferase, partial [Escherichia coli]